MNAPLVPSWSVIGVVVVLLAVAYVFSRIARYVGLPWVVATCVVGIAARGFLPSDLRIDLTPATLGLFLPALMFEGAWHANVAELRREWLPVVLLALPGVAITAVLIGSAGLGFGGMLLPGAFALGGILSATDPVAVLALFRALGVPSGLLTIVEGESIANDGVAAVLFTMALVLAAGAGVSVSGLFVAGVYAPLAGVAIGLLLSKFLGPVLAINKNPIAGIFATLFIAYGSYALASAAGASGIFASAAAGVALPRLKLEGREVEIIERFWERTAFFANAVVFLLVGLSLSLTRFFAEPKLLVATMVAVALSRVILSYVLVPVKNAGGFARGWRHAIALSGIRGGLSLALALGLPLGFPNRIEIVDTVFAVVFLTLVVQGWPLASILRRIPLAPAGPPAVPHAH